MRRPGVRVAKLWVTCVLAAGTSVAAAQPADVTATTTDPAGTPAPSVGLGYAALPGGIHAPSAEGLPRGAMAFMALGGYGQRNHLLSAEHKLTRGIGDLAFAYAPIDGLTLALALDGRMDKHTGTGAKDERGYVGDPRIFARYGKLVGKNVFGGQLAIWVPGKDAPSIAPSAISFDARGLATIAAGPGALSISAGFRLDNSAKSLEDPASTLSTYDQVSLGISDFHSVVASARYAIPFGKAFAGFEGSLDRFIGSGAPGQILRGGANGGFHATKSITVMAFLELAKVPKPGVDVAMNTVDLIPYEPVFTGGLAVSAQFGGPATGSGSSIRRNTNPETIDVIEYADVSGTVKDEAGKPVVGAKITVKLKNNTGTAVSDEKGDFVVSKLPIGKTRDGKTELDDVGAEVTVEVANKKPAKQTLTLAKGGNALPPIALDPMLPPGQLRAVVRVGSTGKPLADAEVTVEPSGLKAKTGADGQLQLDLPPGTYKATATAPGFKPQTLDVTIDPNGVALKNFELAK